MKKFEIGMAMQEKMIELFNDGYVFKPKSWSGGEILFIKNGKQYALSFIFKSDFRNDLKELRWHTENLTEVEMVLSGYKHIGDHFSNEILERYEKGYLIVKENGMSGAVYSPYIYTLDEVEEIAKLREKRFHQKFRICSEIVCPTREPNERTLEILWNAVKKQGGKIRKKDIHKYRYFPLTNGKNSKDIRDYMTAIYIYTNNVRSCILYI